jgi:hypothetical protein
MELFLVVLFCVAVVSFGKMAKECFEFASISKVVVKPYNHSAPVEKIDIKKSVETAEIDIEQFLKVA